jgi:glycosyltransferase involved in cell wall biosynthesis
MKKLTVLIPAFNSEKTLRDTMESVKWADEILLCDSGSTDRTLEIAKEYGARIIQHEYINSALQKNWAIPQCAHEWILQLDSDETLEQGLKEEIKQALQDMDPKVHALKLRRKNYAYGKWLKHGAFYPDYQTRLFLRDFGRFEEREVHAHVMVTGKSKTLRGHILHKDFKDLSTWLIKIERYMRYEYAQLIKEGKAFSIVRAVFYPAALFVRDYLFKRGFMDGWPGFLGAILNSFYYFLKYARLKESQWKSRDGK